MRVLLFLAFAVPLFAQTPCADMARLPNVTAGIQTATHCRVSITLRPTADSEIKSEVWLPAASVWNGNSSWKVEAVWSVASTPKE